ncbi:MAG TPA: type I-C CRISPR-associated protein Cas8c/Csd1 [Verrucomicrobiae bacterium]|jgi:CRISPR-associated protein Csd1
MMLQALITYAERNELGDANFETVGVRWLISLDKIGNLAGVISLAVSSDDKKPKPKRVERPKSDPDFVAHGRSYFLCDSLERSVLLVEEDLKREKRKINQAYFVSLLDAAANECPGIGSKLRLLSAFLRDEKQLKLLHDQLNASKAKTSENAIFSVDDKNLIESAELRNWWRLRSEKERGEQATENSVCLATGRFGSVCRTTGFIKLLGDDMKLISFNKECPAFESLGLSQAANAPISFDSEVKFRAALNTLIEKSRDQKLTFNDTAHLHWTRKPIEDDPIDLLASADENAVAALLKSFQTGQSPVEVDDNKYYAMSLSGNGARIVVRDWLESTVSEIKQHVAEWFQDLGIVSPDGVGVKRDFKFYALLYGLVRAELAELPPQISTHLLHGALRGRSVPLPQSALAAALRRQQIETRKPGDKSDPKLNPARIAIIKACLIRSPNISNHNNQQTTHTMTECLNPESHDPAYLCGRLFAVFAELQSAALQNVNAGVVERYYASASVTPALVMGRLFRNAQFHNAKAEGEGGWKKGKAINAQKDIEAITCALGDKFPATLDLEGQGRFALGYYHQKAEVHRRSAERKVQQAAETAN